MCVCVCVVSSPATHALNEQEGIWYTLVTFFTLETDVWPSNQIAVYLRVVTSRIENKEVANQDLTLLFPWVSYIRQYKAFLKIEFRNPTSHYE